MSQMRFKSWPWLYRSNLPYDVLGINIFLPKSMWFYILHILSTYEQSLLVRSTGACPFKFKRLFGHCVSYQFFVLSTLMEFK